MGNEARECGFYVQAISREPSIVSHYRGDRIKKDFK